MDNIIDLKTNDLDLSLITCDSRIQPREWMNYGTVNQYAEDMQSGAEFPPVVVYYDQTSYWLSQGFHRCAAARVAGLKTISAEIREGTREDALWDAAGSNCEHDRSGLRRTNADKRRAVRMALEAKPKLSDRKIAEQVGVADVTVGRIRSICNNVADSREVTRNGTTYEMRTGNIGSRQEIDSDEEDDEEQESDQESRESRDSFRLRTTPWTESELRRKVQVERGESVLANQRTDIQLVQWAKDRGCFIAIDRGSYPLGNPMRLGDPEPDRGTVISWYREHWLPFFHNQIDWGLLRDGKVLGCWCYPESCHGDVLLEALIDA